MVNPLASEIITISEWTAGRAGRTKAPMRYTIRKRRQAKGISQAKMADLIGVAPSTYSMLESGARRMNEDHLTRIAKALNVTPAELYSERSEAIELLLSTFRALPPEYQARLLEEAEILRRASAPPSPEGGSGPPSKGRKARP
jgi:transcriptional regulator with XRE-family HTH domain